jgi:hypothetical protein
MYPGVSLWFDGVTLPQVVLDARIRLRFKMKGSTLFDSIGFLRCSGFLLHYITNCPILSTCIEPIMSKLTVDSHSIYFNPRLFLGLNMFFM